MEKEILIVKNVSNEGPGLLEDLLKEQEIKYTIIELNQGEKFPHVENYAAMVVLGGPDSANDENEKIRNELLRINECVSAGIPYLGICLGLQTLVKARGGEVFKNPIKEIGFRDPENNFFTVDLTEDGKQDPLFIGLGQTFKIFQLHGETVKLTKDMRLLATGKFCHNQIIKIGKNAYGIQCHFELTPEKFENWISNDPDLLRLDKNQLRKDFESNKKEYNQVGRRLFKNFLKIAGL